MPNNSLLIPVVLLVFLTIVVWGIMLVVRVSAIKSAKIHPQKIKSQKDKFMLPEAANIPAEHFINLLEVPVLFYVLISILIVSDSVSNFFIVGSFIYVALRYTHTFIALTYNKVVHRFTIYVLSCFMLWIMWGVFATELLMTLT